MFNFVEGFAVHVSRFNFVEDFAVLWLTPFLYFKFNVQCFSFNVSTLNS